MSGEAMLIEAARIVAEGGPISTALIILRLR